MKAELVSKSAYARDRGVSAQYIGKLVARGLLPHHGGRLDRAECDAILDAGRCPAPSGGITLLQAQTRKTEAEPQGIATGDSPPRSGASL